MRLELRQREHVVASGGEHTPAPTPAAVASAVTHADVTPKSDLCVMPVPDVLLHMTVFECNIHNDLINCIMRNFAMIMRKEHKIRIYSRKLEAFKPNIRRSKCFGCTMGD